MTPREYKTELERAVAHLSQNDPIMASIIAEHPLPDLAPHTDYYHALVSSIISQQLSVKAAATIKQRFLVLFGDRYPTPEEIIEKDTESIHANLAARHVVAVGAKLPYPSPALF